MDSRTFWKRIIKERSIYFSIWLTTASSAFRSNVVIPSKLLAGQRSHFKVRGRSLCKDGFISVLCSRGGTGAVTGAGGKGRAVTWWWWSRSESSARQESAPKLAAMETYKWWWGQKLPMRGSQTCVSSMSTLARWGLAHGGAIAAEINHAVHIIPSALSAARVFVFTSTGWKTACIFFWSWNRLDRVVFFLQNTPLLSAFHLQHCLLWFFKAAEENNRCVQLAGVFTWILATKIALRRLGGLPSMPTRSAVTESETT